MSEPDPVATQPLGDPRDPRVAAAVQALAKAWDDAELGYQGDVFMAQLVIEEADRVDDAMGVQRVTENLIRSMASRISLLEGALTAAVMSFEQYSGPISIGGPDDLRAPSIAVPTRTVERWRIIAEGGQ